MAIVLGQDRPMQTCLPPIAAAADVSVGLAVLGGMEQAVPQPLQAGIPFPRGSLPEPVSMVLTDSTGAVVPVQTEVLARWPDDSVKWLLLDVVLCQEIVDGAEWRLRPRNAEDPTPATEINCVETESGIVVDTGAAIFTLNRASLLSQVACAGRDMLSAEGLSLTLTDERSSDCRPSIERMVIETRGPIRCTVRVEGTFAGRAPCRFVARLCFFAGSGLLRVRLTIHNPRRARHPGGLWDLGDPGSILFRELALHLRPLLAEPCQVSCVAEPGQPSTNTAGSFEIYQDSSGGANWQSRNHVDRTGKVPCSFRGYRVRQAGGEILGLRANPVVAVHSQSGTVVAAIEEFWQQFPKAIEVEHGRLKASLFPRQFQGQHELQGGEQKTHTLWLNFAGEGGPQDLAWVHRPARLPATPDWYVSSQALPYLAPSLPLSRGEGSRFEKLLAGAVAGDDSFQARREIIDEYGWRNYGDLYADHEGAYYRGPAPVISHYNNQYDVVLGTLLHYLRSGERRWLDIAEPLARHVIDVDIYHTNQDKAGYNGGQFWHTDHYKDAATSTHRCYSGKNQTPGQPYGGGPCNEHNYTTGLLHYYYLTGDKLARAAVLSLADWVTAMDDGSLTPFGLVDDGPTGTASSTTEPTFHGPGRGCGNSINALLDAWLLTGDVRYLHKAETLIRRTIHPRDDVARRNLLDVEMRWSYTVYLSVLARYLHLKAEAGQVDEHYAWAQTSLVRYAGWMLEHEAGYFDSPEKLLFPTETWAAQELRKANAIRWAAPHADEPLRSRLMRRGAELAERAWNDLFRFERPATTRALAILLIEGLKDAAFQTGAVSTAPRSTLAADLGPPTEFVPQRQRVAALLRSPKGLACAVLRLANPRRWLRYLGRCS